MPTASAFLCFTAALRSYQPNSSLNPDAQQKDGRFAARVGRLLARRYASDLPMKSRHLIN